LDKLFEITRPPANFTAWTTKIRKNMRANSCRWPAW
jgi:hypothetical protein